MIDGGVPLGHRYLLHEVIGRGAMGEVRRATARDTGEEFAAKVLRPELAADEDVVARFVQERRILMRISSPNVVAVRDLVVEADTLAIVADLVRGPNLRTYLDAAGTLAPSDAVAVAVQVLHGLAAAHALGVVHRDVKPENVLVDTTMTPSQAHLSDFGIARLTRGPSLTRLTVLIGTPGYLAPELSEREHATPAADVYSTGIMLYELVTGTTPFATGVDPVAVLLAAREKVPGRVPGFPDRLWEVFVSMVARAPGDRPDAAGAARALGAVAAGLGGLQALPRLERPPDPETSEPERATVATPGRSGSRTAVDQAGGPGGESPAEASRRASRRRLAIVAALAMVVAVAGSVVAIALTRALFRPFRRADPHRQRKCVEVDLLDPGRGTHKISSAVEQKQRYAVTFKKASTLRPNLGEQTFPATIQRDDVLKSVAIRAASVERDRYAGDDLLLIARLQHLDPGICRRLEANVLEAPPTEREQAQRIERAKRRSKHRDNDARTSNLRTAPPGVPQAQHLIILDPLIVSASDANRDDFGGGVVEDDWQDVKPDQPEPIEGERAAHHQIVELRRFMENLLDDDHRHDRGGGDGQPAEHVAINRDQRCPAG